MNDVHFTAESRLRRTILMTEGSSNSARQALYALGPQHTIDVIDPSPLCQSRFSSFVRRWYRCPPFAKEPCAYLTFLRKLLAEQKYDVLFPVHDEVYLLSRVRDSLCKYTAAAIPEFESITRLQSKTNFLELLRELGLPHPETHVVNSRAEIDAWSDFPRYLKLDVSTAGQGVQLVRNRGELQASVRTFEEQGTWSDGHPLLLQRTAVGEQAVARAVFNCGQLIGIHMSRLRKRGVGGAAMARASCLHPPVIEHVRRIGKKLAWHGPLFLEYFFDATTNMPAYIEGDSRIGDSGNATLSGVNLCQMCIDVATGEARPLSPQSTGDVRSHSGFLLLISSALNGTSRHEILREIWRQWRRRDIYEQSFDEVTCPREDWLSVIPYAWVAARLLLRPASGATIIQKTVENYALSHNTAEQISKIPLDQLTACLDG
jgi:predicted ATP-grasp superfamily ATP-dependent carboligase